MKKIISLGLSFVFVFLCGLTISIGGNLTAHADEWNGMFKYSYLDNGTISIDKYLGSTSEVVIPKSIDGVNVTEIGSHCFTKNENVRSITVPDGVKTICNGAFEDCPELIEVNMSDSVEEVGDALFKGSYKLKNVRLSLNLTRISKSMFYDCSSLESINISEKITEIGESAFINCSSLKSVSLPDTVKKIGDYAFGYYTKDGAVVKCSDFKIQCSHNTAAEEYAAANGIKSELAHSHEYSVVKIVAPTYFADGYTFKQCSCGAQIKTDVKAKLKLGTVKGLKVSAVSTSSVNLIWSKVKNADGYIVYRYDAVKKKWIKVGQTSKNTLSLKKLKSGSEYKFAVKAYKKSGTNYAYGVSSKISAVTNPVSPKVKATAQKNKVVLSWQKVSGATGYKVYFKSSPKAKYKAIKTTTSIKFTKTKLQSGKKYYFAVKSYTRSGKTIRYSKVTYVTAKV